MRSNDLDRPRLSLGAHLIELMYVYLSVGHDIMVQSVVKIALFGTKPFHKIGNLVNIEAVQSILIGEPRSANMCGVQLYNLFVLERCLWAT